MSLLPKIILYVTICTNCIIVTTAREIALSYVPVVMLGYDVVAYNFNVTGCHSILGNKKYSYQLSSADVHGIGRLYEFWFADQNNLNIFKSDPWRWTPRFGGFSSYGTCCELPPDYEWASTFQGPAAGPDKNSCGFRVHTDGYLYLNRVSSSDDAFFSNADENIENAETRWIEWYGSLTAGPFNHYCFSTFGHLTIDDCVEFGQRYAPAADPNEEIYSVDEQYYDEWFGQYDYQNNTFPACIAVCRICPDGSCQPRDAWCAWQACPPRKGQAYLLFAVIGLGVVLVIVFIVAFTCIYGKRNKTLQQNFEHLADEENTNINAANSSSINDQYVHETETGVCETNISDEAIHDNILQTETGPR